MPELPEVEIIKQSLNKKIKQKKVKRVIVRNRNLRSKIPWNFTSFLKDSTIMGPEERTASYILRKSQGKFQISGMVPHTTIAK